MPLATGTTLGSYKIIGTLGAGGMGEVYRASDAKLGREVALLILPTSFAQNLEYMVRFQREAKVLAALNHPNIGAIYGLEESENGRALVLELIEGSTLAERLQAGPLPLDEALAVARQIAEAVEVAHETGIVHRDLKPANIKLCSDDRVKVLDFGLARANEGDATVGLAPNLSQSSTITGVMTGADVILGTAAYMSPEQARGCTMDKRADIWAFGVILFEMITGKQLFTGETISDTLASVLKEELPWDSLPASTPIPILHLLQRCLQRDTKRRLRDIGEACILLDRVLNGASDTTTIPEPTIARRTSRRAHPGILLAMLGVAAVAALAAWLLKPNPTDLPLRKFAITFDAADPSLSIELEPALAPDGSHLAYVSRNRLWIRNLADLQPREVVDTDGARHPFWSPDGRWVAYGIQQTIWKVSREGGQPVMLATFPGSNVFGSSASGSWGTDGRIVLCFGTSGLLEVSAQGGDPTSFLDPSETDLDFHDVTGLPAGRGWVFVVHRKEGGYNTLGVLSRDGQRKDILIQDGQSLYDPTYSPTGHLLFQRAPTASGIWAVPFSLANLECTGESFLVVAGGSLPTIGTDGTLVYAHGISERHTQLVWADRDGDILDSIGEPDQLYPYPSLSPDGTRVVIRKSEGEFHDLWVHDVTRNTRSRLTFTNEREDYATWHPDGTLLYTYTTGDEGWYIFALLADGTGEPQKITAGILPFPTPDGAQLLFAKAREGTSVNWDLWQLSLVDEEAEPSPFIVSEAAEWWAVPSPDGRHVAYVSDESGRNEVYATTLPVPHGKWQVSTAGGDWPQWCADGRELFYAVDNVVMSVEISTTSGVVLGQPRVLFNRAPSGYSLPWPDGFDVTADGERFIFAKRAATEDEKENQPKLALVQNWYAEFAGEQ